MKNKGEVYTVRHRFKLGFLAPLPFFPKLHCSTIPLSWIKRTNRSLMLTLQHALQKPKLDRKHWQGIKQDFYLKQTDWRVKLNYYTCCNNSSNGCYLLLCKKSLHFLVCYQLLKLHNMQEEDTFFFDIMINPVKTWRCYHWSSTLNEKCTALWCSLRDI